MSEPSARDRRRHVRMRPIAELPVRASVRVASSGEVSAAVSDISVGGVGLTLSESLAALALDSTIEVTLDLGRYGTHHVRTKIRHMGRDEPGVLGTEFVELDGAPYAAVKKYVAELLERGAPS